MAKNLVWVKMEYYKIILEPQSPFSQLFTADQVWGQIIWAINYLYGEEEATNLVSLFEYDPPFLVSSMIPYGYLPNPILPPNRQNCVGKNEKEVEARKKAKKIKKQEWLSLKRFSEVQNDINSIYNDEPELFSVDLNKITEIHATIDRLQNKTLQNGLYNSQYITSNSKFVIYLCLKRDFKFWMDKFIEILEYLEKTHLGGDRNIGRGYFKIKLKELNELETKIFECKNCNKVMTISRCFGSNIKPFSYRVSVYAGITGNNGNSNFSALNKKPIIYLENGSILDEGIGNIAHPVSRNSKICSYGYVFPIPINYKENF